MGATAQNAVRIARNLGYFRTSLDAVRLQNSNGTGIKVRDETEISPLSARPFVMFDNFRGTCPVCHGVAHRIRRRLVDRLISMVVMRYRYRCESMLCGWEGNLPVLSLSRAKQRGSEPANGRASN